LGRSTLTLEQFDAFPGRSRGYAGLPLEMRRQIVRDVPSWSELITREATAEGLSYVDTSEDFSQRLKEAETVLTGNDRDK
jgi:hypothetical protein